MHLLFNALLWAALCALYALSVDRANLLALAISIILLLVHSACTRPQH